MAIYHPSFSSSQQRALSFVSLRTVICIMSTRKHIRCDVGSPPLPVFIDSSGHQGRCFFVFLFFVCFVFVLNPCPHLTVSHSWSEQEKGVANSKHWAVRSLVETSFAELEPLRQWLPVEHISLELTSLKNPPASLWVLDPQLNITIPGTPQGRV